MSSRVRLVLILIVISTISIILMISHKQEVEKRAEISEKEIPMTVIYGKPVYKKIKFVVVNSSKAYLPLDDVNIARKLWPSFGIRVVAGGSFKKDERFEFRRVLMIDASENITGLSIGSGKILYTPQNFREFKVKIDLVGENFRESAEIYSEKGYPVAFFWKNRERLKLKPGIYRLEVVVSGVPKVSTYSDLYVLLDVSFSVPLHFLQNESVTKTIEIDSFKLSYRVVGSFGRDEAWSVDKGIYVGGFIVTSKDRDAIVIRLNDTKILWAKIWRTDEDEWIWDVSEGEGCVYSAVLSSLKSVLLKLSDKGEFVWAKELKLLGKDVLTDITAVACRGECVFAGGNFLAKLADLKEPEVLWCRYPFGFIRDIRLSGDCVYILDNTNLFKFDSQGNVIWAKRIKGRHYMDLKSMYVTPSGIYVLCRINDSAAVLMLDHDANLRWAKLLLQERMRLPSSIYVDEEIYIVGDVPKDSFLAIFDPKTDKAQGIVISGSELRDVVSFGDTIYCVGIAQNQSLEIHLVNYTVSNINIMVKNINQTFESCLLSLNNTKGLLEDFAVGRGEKGDILLVEVSLNQTT